MGVPEVRPGDPIRASQWNEIVRRLLLSIRAGTGLTSTHIGNTLTFALAPGISTRLFWAEVVDKGPAGEADFTDCRYWVREVVSLYGGLPGAPPVWGQVTADGAFYVSASNLSELQDDTHSLLTDGSVRVLVLQQFDGSNPIYGFCAEYTPSGIIAMWGGVILDIPHGWTLCDGGNDSKGVATPDLRSRFIVGYDPGEADYDAIAKTGGFKLHGTTENSHDNHASGAYPYTVTTAPLETPLVEPGTHSDSDNRPPYYVLAFIRKD